ncbi:Arf-GAP with Rho-GAP domain, ANK repeat and PH domain-containing protein 3 [Pseudolycoriella hygida]|uniref:Arf-GAP with Rho-GAP domain, ANK repeat and PH domain-containing protein 3 n=1 Tax=Pseudolycoriella hygida TaxID=35572 RepID=A0A9Q0S0X9_9DIPT|nr:Arf-GAP with Rho-GAP domain, ANK repeat and PH domain-containing protein 3 [Pseudolycoriella hygida]
MAFGSSPVFVFKSQENAKTSEESNKLSNLHEIVPKPVPAPRRIVTEQNLHIEAGPMLMIDCPPHSLYMIMASPRETKVWRHIIKEVAHNNGPSLKEQQLTKDDVPVIVDKCINFIYAQGSMSEGIYRKSGSENSINKLLKLFRTDAFSVQITRTEYNEHDVSNVLKRFMRDLPDRLLGKYTASFISVTEMRTKSEKVKAYKELLSRLPTIEYQTLKKLIAHLHFIQSQKIRNKMGVDNLSIIWGPTLLQDKNAEMQYSQKEADVIIELICLYKNLYQLTSDELAKEQIMLSVLQKYHAAAENLSDTVKQSGDLKVWITLDGNPDNEIEEKPQVNVTLTPTKTVYDVCKELASKINRPPFAITLSEIILNGALQRPLHYSEKLFDVVLKWSYWPECDRKDNFLRLRPMKFLKDVERALKNLPTVSPNKELKFADCKTKAFKSYTLELVGDRITVMKKEKSAVVQVKEINLRHATAYIGCEKKRDFQLRWAITLIESDPNTNIMRTRDSPYIGHVIAGTNSNDSLVWYSSILHSLYGDNITPNPEIIHIEFLKLFRSQTVAYWFHCSAKFEASRFEGRNHWCRGLKFALMVTVGR